MKIQILIAGCILTVYISNAFAESNLTLDTWRNYANTSTDTNHSRWVEEISKPAAIELASKWKKLRGYDAYDLLAKHSIPADLKPGLTINKNNFSQYPWLKEFMVQEMYDALTEENGFIHSISIVPSNTYYMHQGTLDATQSMNEKDLIPTTNENSTLVNPDGSLTLINNDTAGAIPYLHPKNGLELNWNYVAHGVGTDTAVFDPITANACTPDKTIEREYIANMWWQKFHGRSIVGDEPSLPDREEFIEGGSVFAFSPFDVRGFAGVRLRYAEGQKTDDFKIFLPATSRTRTLTGSDAEDPIWAGLELTWDDWRAYWSKTNIDRFDYQLLGETIILASPEVGYVYDPIKLSDSGCEIVSMELELRPVWILEITDKSGSYSYRKRTTYIDKELYYLQYHVTTDQRDNAFRTWDDVRAWRPDTGESQWRQIVIHNEINHRSNFIQMTPIWDERDEVVTEEHFDVDQLRDYQ